MGVVGNLMELKGSDHKKADRFMTYCNDVTIRLHMKDHAPKSVPDRVLTSMILQTIVKAESEGMELTSKEIHFHISHPDDEWYFESPDLDRNSQPLWSGKFEYDNLPGVRTALSYCLRAGYILKRGAEKPHVFIITDEGRQMAVDPFFKYKLKQQYFMKLAEEEVKRLLNSDEQVEALAEQKRIEKCKDCRLSNPKAKRLPARTNTVKPYRGKILVNRKDDSIREYEVNEETGEIQELEDIKKGLVMKGKDPDIPSTILSQQNEIEAMRKVLAEAGIRYEKQSVELAKEKGRKTQRTEREFVRQMDRMGLAHYYLENNLYLDAQFFDIWSGSLVVVEYKRTLDMQILSVFYDIQSTRGEIMIRTDYARRILEHDEIEAVGIYVIEIKASSIVVDSQHFQAPKPLQV